MRQLIPGLGLSLLLTAALVLSAGCGGSKAPKPTEQAKNTEHGHDHPHEGPHDGALAEWGDEKYHAEFTVDHDRKQATVYILDGTAKKAAPIPAESTVTVNLTNLKPAVQITLKADPDKDDPKGKSSRFVGTHDELAKKMEFKGEISGTVEGTPFNGKFEEHEHHEHKKK